MSTGLGFLCRVCGHRLAALPGQTCFCRNCGRKNYAPVPEDQTINEVQAVGEIQTLDDEVVVSCAACQKVFMAEAGKPFPCPDCGRPCDPVADEDIVPLVRDTPSEMALRVQSAAHVPFMVGDEPEPKGGGVGWLILVLAGLAGAAYVAYLYLPRVRW